MKDRKLYRSTKEKMLFGVCGGVAEYFDVDPTIVRVLFAVGALLNGVGIVLYLVLAIIMPKPTGMDSMGAETGQGEASTSPQSSGQSSPSPEPPLLPSASGPTPTAQPRSATPPAPEHRPDDESQPGSQRTET